MLLRMRPRLKSGPAFSKERETELLAMLDRLMANLRTGRLEAAQTSALHLELLRDLKLINSHIVAAVAYPVLERTGGCNRAGLLRTSGSRHHCMALVE